MNDKRIPGQCYVRLEHSDRLRFGFGPDLFIIQKITSLPVKSSADPKLFAEETESFRNSDSPLNIEIEDKLSRDSDLNKDPVQRLIIENSGSNSSRSNSVDSLEEIKSSKLLMSAKVSDKKQLPEMNEEVSDLMATDAPNTCSSPSAAPNSLDSTGSATAFIVSFDDDDNKKLNIKDSLRQFAPPKPDSIEKPRPKSAKSESKSNENSFSSEKSPTTRPKRQKNAPAPNKSKDNPKQAAAIVIADNSGNLSDSAAYLINRMLSNRKLTTTPSNSRPGSSEDYRVEKTDSGVSDDIKSDSGNTYTIDDNNDELVNARRRIDEVFGVNDNDNDSATISLNSSPDSSLTLNSPTLLKNIEHSNQLSKTRHLLSSPKFDRKSIASDSDAKLYSTNNSNSTFTRTKRRVPTVEEMLHFNAPKRDDKQKVNSAYVGSNDLNRSYRSPLVNKSDNDNKVKAGATQSAPSTPRSPLMARRLMEMRINSKQNPKTININHRKNSWNSDMDYYELYNSDDSTDQSHRSSNSALSKDNGHTSTASVPSKINLNRTFALRRARLGIETPGIDLSSKKPNNNLSRNDGGRFSLRVTKKDSLSDTNSGKKPVNRISSKESLIKTNLHRKGSDPFTGVKASVNKCQSVSDTERRNALNNNNNRFNQLTQSVNQNNSRQNPNLNNTSTCYGCNSTKKTFTNLSTPQKFVNKAQRHNHSDNNSLKNYNIGSYDSDRNMSCSATQPTHKPPISSYKSVSKTGLELTALDGLVISAISQLSHKLRNNMIDVMESQRPQHPSGSPHRILIDEVLPQMTTTDRRLNENGVSVSRDLSAILKNLKKVEQSLEGK